jgi:choline transporter-like protein 2/4/5
VPIERLEEIYLIKGRGGAFRFYDTHLAHSRSADAMTNSEEKYGVKIPYDPLWKGPMDHSRSPTDRIWLITFLIYLALYASIAIYGFSAGDLNKLATPTDYAGRSCGYDSDVKSKPYLLLLDMKSCIGFEDICDTPSVCVSECPSENFIYNEESKNVSLDAIKEKLFCTSDINITAISSFSQLDILIDHKKCAKWYLKSQPEAGKCLAFNAWEGHESETITSDELAQVRNAIREQDFIINKFYNDIKSALSPSVIAIICGGVIALLYVVLLKWFATPFFFASIVMFLSFIVYGIYQLSTSYAKYKTGESLFALIIMILLAVGVIIVVIYFRKKIYLACLLVKESSKAVLHLPSTLAFPIFPWLLYIIITVLGVSVFMCFVTITKSNYRVDKINDGIADGCNCSIAYIHNFPCDPVAFNNECNANGQPCQFWQCRLYGKSNPSYVYFLHAINLVGFYWLIFFVSGFEYMVLGGVFATWYWSFNKKSVRNHALIDSTFITVRYHMGTVALGAFILTISQIIRTIFQGIQSRLQNGGNGCASGFLCCFRYIFELLDSLLNFLSYNAYIMCAVHGKSFMQSAKNAFNLIMRNIVKVVVVDTVTDWLFIMAKLLVTSLAVAGVMLYYNYSAHENLDAMGVSVIVTAVGTYIIASVFFSVQTVAVKTIFLCFVEDSERNDGSEERPYYMSNKLKQLLHK